METTRETTSASTYANHVGRAARVLVVGLLLGLMAALMSTGPAAAKTHDEQEALPEFEWPEWRIAWECWSANGELVHLGGEVHGVSCLDKSGEIMFVCGRADWASPWKCFWLPLSAPDGSNAGGASQAGELTQPERPEANVLTDANHIIIMNGVAKEMAEPDHGIVADTSADHGLSAGLIVRP